MKRLALLALLLSASAIAQDLPVETVAANSASLSGLWQISVPSSVGIDLAQTAQFGPMKNLFCRIDQADHDLEIHCLNGGYARSGDGTVENGKVHLAWGTMMARFVIDAVRDGSSLHGTYAVKLAGIRHDAPLPSVSNRVHATGDAGGPAAVLLREALGQAAQGRVTLLHDDAAIAKNEGGWPKKLAVKGAIVLVARMGTSPRLGHPGEPDFFTVYDVLFEKGELLCGLHQRTDGVLDGFVCV